MQDTLSWVEAAVEAAGDGWLLHGGGRILHANPAVLRLLGYSREELREKGTSEVFCGHPDREGRYETNLTRRDGSLLAVEVDSRPLDGGAAVVSVVRDISERTRALERLQAAVESAGDGVWEWNGETGEVYCSPEWVALLGCVVEDLPDGWPTFVHPEDLPAVSAALRQHLEGVRSTWRVEFRLRRTDGAWIWVLVRAQVMARNAAGEPSRLVGTLSDISEQKQAEEKHRRDEYWLSESQRNARIGTYVLDLASGMWTSTETLDEIFGIGPEYVRSVEGWHAIMHPDDADSMVSYLLSEVISKQNLFDRFYRIVRRDDGQERWVHGMGRLFRDAAGKPVTMVGTIQDITERREMEQQLLHTQRMESVGQLAGGVAHDFNNLLTVINGYSKLVLDTMDGSDPRRANLAEILRAGERAASLTQQLLAFSRRQVLQLRVLDLNAAITDTKRMLERLIGEHIQLTTRLCAPAPLIRADQGQINQVLINLAVNARDAMPHGGSLTIATSVAELPADPSDTGSQAGTYACLSVADTGVGMDAATQQRIFEPFFTTKPTGEGTGLGLATVYGIVRQSEGRIKVASEVGAGAAFQIYLPLVDEEVERTEARPAEAQAGSCSGTVLVVEDQENVRKLVSTMLSNAGFRVLQAASGTEALAISDEYRGPISLVLTDVVMPGMTGQSLVTELRLRRKDTRALYMSGYAGNIVSSRGISEEGADFLQKPFSTRDLIAKVRQMLDAEPRPAP